MKIINTLWVSSLLELIREIKKSLSLKKILNLGRELLGDIKFHADISADRETADKKNYQRYEELARKIATLRNQRIESSKAQIKGFNSDSVNVEVCLSRFDADTKGRKS